MGSERSLRRRDAGGASQFARRRPWNPSRRLRGDAGNTLVLFPAAVLIVFGLGAVAIDSATLFLGQRRLADLAASIANDAVGGVDLASFYEAAGGQGTIVLDTERAAARGGQLLGAQPQDRGFEEVQCAVEVEVMEPRATVTCTAVVRPILAPLWALGERQELTVTETAEGRQG